MSILLMPTKNHSPATTLSVVGRMIPSHAEIIIETIFAISTKKISLIVRSLLDLVETGRQISSTKTKRGRLGWVKSTSPVNGGGARNAS